MITSIVVTVMGANMRAYMRDNMGHGGKYETQGDNIDHMVLIWVYY